MTVDPSKWPEAETYFRFYAEGRYDNFNQIGYIYSRDGIRESDDGGRLYIGRPGVDGIEFLYRRGSPSIWAYYPIDGEFVWKADDIESFEQAWKAGSITL